MRRTLFVTVALALGGGTVQAAYRLCHESTVYDGCECRSYQRGKDQTVAPSTHPTQPELCNLINIQTAFDFAVDQAGAGLTVTLLRGAQYPLSVPVYAFQGDTVVATINDGIIRARAHGQRWTSAGSGPLPRVSLAPFRGYDEHEPTHCEPPFDTSGNPRDDRKNAEHRPGFRCRRHPKHQMQIFEADTHRVTIEHLELDGGLDPTCTTKLPPFGGWRRDFARPALVELGWSDLASGTIVHDNVVANVPGWTALHLGEGRMDQNGVPACQSVEVYGNTFSGLGYNFCDPALGDDGAPRECYWSDAISMACGGIVRDNVIRDPTDVGIVAFVGGVTVQDNVVTSSRSKGFGGIVAVDEFRREDGTWVANHDRTLIVGNTVRAEPGGAFDVGIGLGWWAWSCEAQARPTFAGSLVIGNHIQAAGGRMNYGLAVTLADGVTEEGLGVGVGRVCTPTRCFDTPLPNTFSGEFGGGTPGIGCGGRPAGPPSAYVVNSCSRCQLQEGYRSGSDYKLLLGGLAPVNPPTCRSEERAQQGPP